MWLMTQVATCTLFLYRLHSDCFEKGGDVWLDEERQTDADDMDREVKQG